MTTSSGTSPRIRHRPPPGQAAPSPAPAPAATEDEISDSYAVGYAKPPAAHRFKPGQSGNPKGRPKGARGLNAMVRKLLDKKMEIRVEGRLRRVPRIEALLRKQIELAAKGDARSMERIIAAYRQAVPDASAAEPRFVAEDSETDAAILAAYRQLVADELRATEEKL